MQPPSRGGEVMMKSKVHGTPPRSFIRRQRSPGSRAPARDTFVFWLVRPLASPSMVSTTSPLTTSRSRRTPGPVSSVSSLIFLDPHPFLLAAYSDGSIGVWGMKGSSLKGLLVLTFRNQAPAGASFWDEEDAEYPLMR